MIQTSKRQLHRIARVAASLVVHCESYKWDNESLIVPRMIDLNALSKLLLQEGYIIEKVGNPTMEVAGITETESIS